MCSIFGALGDYDKDFFTVLRSHAADRGRDGGRVVNYVLPDNRTIAVLGNWRATPTPELEHGELQPYQGVVHNGTIANDAVLGSLPGEIDSQVLARILGRGSLEAFRTSLGRVVGSYALACVTDSTIYLACNYKPIYLWSQASGHPTYFSSMARHFDGLIPRYQSPQKMEPYSVLDLASGETLSLPRDGDGEKHALVIASSGLDSTTVAAKLIADGYVVRLLHFRYGCRAEASEAAAIWRLASKLGCSYDVIPLDYSQTTGASSLFSDASGSIASGITGAEYAHEWVPARNLVMLAHAVAYAEANGFHTIALGNNLEEAGAYPDNEEEFTTLLDALLPHAVRDGYRVNLISPVGALMKHEVVRLGLSLGVPYELTWSCYRSADEYGRACGDCGPCFMRRTAFARNGVTDPLSYCLA